MGKRVLTIALCLALGCLVLFAGCGGGDGGGSTAGGEGSSLEGTSETKQEYVAKANGVCEKQQKAMQADASSFLKKKAGTNASVEANQRGFVEQVLAPGLEAEAEALRKLGAPKGEEEEVKAVIVAIERVVEEASQDPAAYFKGITGSPMSQEASQAAAAYGIPACGTIS